MHKSLQRVEVAMEQLARIGQSRHTNTQRAARAGLHLTGVTQKVLRGVMENAPVRISDLARAVYMSDAVVSRQITQLEEGGFVARCADAGDGRVTRVRPTATGRSASRRLRSAADTIFQEHLSDWRVRDLDTLADLMEKLVVDLRDVDTRSR